MSAPTCRRCLMELPRLPGRPKHFCSVCAAAVAAEIKARKHARRVAEAQRRAEQAKKPDQFGIDLQARLNRAYSDT